MIDELEAALEKLCGADPSALADGESVGRLHRCLARLEAAATRATATFETKGEWRAEGARSAAAWLSVRCRLPKTAARRRVRLGRALRHLPAAERAWVAGDIGGAQVAALAAARTALSEAALARDEEMLVGQAATLRYDLFNRALAYWLQHADPDGVEHRAAAQHEARRFHLSRSFAGTWLGDLVLDPIAGAVVANHLSSIEDELFAADWAEAAERLGDDVRASKLARTPAQRRADALVEMARRAGTAPAGGRRPEPLFTVLVGYETFAGRVCQLADGTVVSPGSLLAWLDEAWVERVVFDGPSRVVDVGAARRLFSGATLRALQVRDGECFHEFCDLPAGQCQADHIEPWSAGGRTVTGNGRMACGYHNRRRHGGRRPPNRPPPRGGP